MIGGIFILPSFKINDCKQTSENGARPILSVCDVFFSPSTCMYFDGCFTYNTSTGQYGMNGTFTPGNCSEPPIGVACKSVTIVVNSNYDVVSSSKPLNSTILNTIKKIAPIAKTRLGL